MVQYIYIIVELSEHINDITTSHSMKILLLKILTTKMTFEMLSESCQFKKIDDKEQTF